VLRTVTPSRRGGLTGRGARAPRQAARAGSAEAQLELGLWYRSWPPFQPFQHAESPGATRAARRYHDML